MTELRPLLNPRSIAVVGASPRGNRGLQILQNLQRFGSTARIYPVHPREESVAGLQAYPDIASLPEVCEFVAIALDADRGLDVLEEAIGAGIGAGMLIASGFGEGGTGADRSRRLNKLLAESGFLLCGPNCYGILNAATGFAAYSGKIVEPFTPGPVGLVMQSGALTHSVTDSAVGRGLGLSHLITTGNEAGVSLGQYVRALAHDDNVGVIGLFIEGLRDADDFAAAAIEAAQQGKPVVALTVGRSERAQHAAHAHTGAIAGHGAALSGLLRRCGAVQAADIDEFREMLTLFASGIKPTADAAAIASISGGGTGLLADLAEDVGLELAAFEPGTAARLTEALPDFATVANPLDLTGAAAEDHSIADEGLSALQADPGVGLVILALNVLRGAKGQEDLYRDQARVLAKRADAEGSPVLALSLTSGPCDEVVAASLAERGVPLLAGARPGLRAINAWLSWHGRPAPRPLAPAAEPAPSWGAEPVLTGKAAMDLLSSAGITVPAALLADSAETVADHWDALEPPVVLKVEAAGLAHKTEVGGVVTGITDREELEQAASQMLARARSQQLEVDGFLIQQQVVADAVECIVGVIRDPQVGLVLTVAPGGVLAELSGPAATTPVPAGAAEVEELINSSALVTLLDGYRGAPRRDRTALVALVQRFSDLVTQRGPDLVAAELNPVLVLPEGQGAVAVDALFVKEES